MKTLYIIRGIPGSGKSTLARSLTENICEADDFFIKNGRYLFDHNKLKEAHASCFHKCESFMKQNKNTIAVANTFVRKWEYANYLELATKWGYTAFIIVCTNTFQNTHDVPKHTVIKMKNKFEL